MIWISRIDRSAAALHSRDRLRPIVGRGTQNSLMPQRGNRSVHRAMMQDSRNSLYGDSLLNAPTHRYGAWSEIPHMGSRPIRLRGSRNSGL